MTTDPSWLYSTIAQSSAAIVAIIGGFITASVLSLNAEKRNLKNQLKDQKATLEEYKSKNISTTKLEVDIPILEDRIKAFSFPPNLKWGIVVLGYLTVFCIFWPVLIIASEAFCTWSRNLSMYSFFFGILLVFAYIVFQISTLRR